MIYIDLPADLNLEDEEGRNIARLADAVTPDTVTQGAVLVVGTRSASTATLACGSRHRSAQPRWCCRRAAGLRPSLICTGPQPAATPIKTTCAAGPGRPLLAQPDHAPGQRRQNGLQATAVEFRVVERLRDHAVRRRQRVHRGCPSLPGHFG